LYPGLCSTRLPMAALRFCFSPCSDAWPGPRAGLVRVPHSWTPIRVISLFWNTGIWVCCLLGALCRGAMPLGFLWVAPRGREHRQIFLIPLPNSPPPPSSPTKCRRRYFARFGPVSSPRLLARRAARVLFLSVGCHRRRGCVARALDRRRWALNAWRMRTGCIRAPLRSALRAGDLAGPAGSGRLAGFCSLPPLLARAFAAPCLHSLR